MLPSKCVGTHLLLPNRTELSGINFLMVLADENVEAVMHVKILSPTLHGYPLVLSLGLPGTVRSKNTMTLNTTFFSDLHFKIQTISPARKISR
jgi:hypothetical protein